MAEVAGIAARRPPGHRPGRGLGGVLLGQRGAVLLEVLVASVILVLALLPIFCALTATLLVLEKSTLVTVATNLLQDRAEVLKAAGYNLVPQGSLWLEKYSGRPFDIYQEVSLVETMTDSSGTVVVKKVVLVIYRHPYASGGDPVARMEFLLYAGGI